MKHIFIIISVLISFAGVANGQRLNFNVAGGLSSHYGGSTKSIGSLKLGVSYEWEIPGNFSIEPGVNFYAKGYKDRNETVFIRDNNGEIIKNEDGSLMTGIKNVSTAAYYVEVPVMANYYVEVSPLHYIEFSAGPYAAVGVGGKRKIRGDADEEASRRYYYEKNTFKEDGVRRFDCGIAAGIAYEFNKTFAVGVEADFGLLKFSDNGGRNISGVIKFSYRLPLDI